MPFRVLLAMMKRVHCSVFPWNRLPPRILRGRYSSRPEKITVIPADAGIQLD
jgi:hypothetical protein